MKKNDEITLDIFDISEDGSGIGRHEGMVFFVKGALPGDVILAGVTALKKNHGYARIIKINKPSPHRVNPQCSVAGKCGGCSIMHLSYKAQLSFKEKRVKDVLVRIGGFSEDDIQKALKPIIGMDEPLHFRNKSQYPVSQDENGDIHIGFYVKRSHRIVDVPTSGCCIGDPIDIGILSKIKDFIVKYNTSIYDEKNHSGLIRHILIRSGKNHGDVMVCIVANGDRIPHEEDLVRLLTSEDRVRSICININTNRGNVILGNKTRILWGERTIADSFRPEGMEKDTYVRISARSFYQVNPIQMEKLYGKVYEYAALSGKEILWDIYCGIGTIGLSLAPYAKSVFGVEEIPNAIEDAIENAKLNKIENASFVCGKAEDVLTDNENYGTPDVVVIDPPRAGCEESVLFAILKALPKRIVYVSCNPSTLARDASILCGKDGSYEISEITPVDQFCHGMHVETVILMSRKDK